MHSSDTTLIRIIDYLIFMGAVENSADFARRVGMARSNLSAIKGGRRSFTVEQIRTACEVFNLNANCIVMGESEVFRNRKYPVLDDILITGPSDHKSNLKITA